MLCLLPLLQLASSGAAVAALTAEVVSGDSNGGGLTLAFSHGETVVASGRAVVGEGGSSSSGSSSGSSFSRLRRREYASPDGQGVVRWRT